MMMTKTKYILWTTVISALVAFAVTAFTGPAAEHVVAATKESALDRVLRTKTLRCGYNVWAPAVTVDPNSGAVGGFIPEIVEYAAHSVGIKVQWVAQAGWGTFPQDLQNGKFDAMCAGTWATKELAPYVAFTRPIFFNAVFAYVRSDDHRFDKDLSILNDPQYKIGSVDTAISETIAKNDYPNAVIVGLPQLTDPGQTFEDLSQGKSDVVFMEAAFTNEYMAKNPDKIRPLNAVPVRSFPSPLIAVDIHEASLAMMMDTIVGEMQLQGTIDRIMNKYGADRAMFIPPASPYEVTE